MAGGAKGRVDVTNEISTSDMKKLSSKLHNYSGKSPDWWVNHYQNLPKTNVNYAATREDALKSLSNDIQRNPKKSKEIKGNPWKSKEIQRNPWKSKRKSHEIQ